ncbi:MAG: hypothetical protein AMXMBFR53_01240 [Gemmatimonadota bacterium]
MSHTARPTFAPLPRGVALGAAALVATAVLAAARQVAALAPFTDHPALLSTAATLDVTVVLTLLCWWILGRTFGWPALALVPLFLLSLVVAGRVLPEVTRSLRVMHLAAAPLELAAIAWVVRKARSPGRLHDVLAYEAEVLATALGGWRRREPPAGALTVHRKAAWGAVVGALLLVTAAEVAAVHVVVSRWSPALAWVLTSLGIYGALWLLGDWKACRARPLVLEDGTLRIRFGLRWKVDVPVDRIVAVRVASGPGLATKPAADLRLALPGAPQVVLELDRPVTAVGIYGLRREARTLALGLDEPRRLADLLSRAGAPSTTEQPCP